MRRAPLSLLAVFAVCGLAQAQPPAPTPAPAPAVNWVLPLFSREGFRTMTLRGLEARPAAANRIGVTDLNITVFSGDAAAKITTILLSSSAIFDPQARRATGEKSVRILRDDLEATGTTWSYDEAQKRVTLTGDVRIIFNAEIKDLLK